MLFQYKYKIFSFQAKDEHIGFLLSEISKVIQVTLITLDYFFAGIAEYSKVENNLV